MTSPLTCEEFPPQVSCCGPLSSFLETFLERHRCWQLGWKVSGERRGRRRSDGAPVLSARWPKIVSLGGGGGKTRRRSRQRWDDAMRSHHSGGGGELLSCFAGRVRGWGGGGGMRRNAPTEKAPACLRWGPRSHLGRVEGGGSEGFRNAGKM